jgi:hypothetical protein
MDARPARARVAAARWGTKRQQRRVAEADSEATDYIADLTQLPPLIGRPAAS